MNYKIIYKVEWTEKAYQALEALNDLNLEFSIKERVENHLASHPFQNGIPLKGKLEGLWRYRCLDEYRVIYQIIEDKIIIKVLGVGHRWANFYEKFKRDWN